MSTFLKIEINGLQQAQSAINESYQQFLERVATTVEDATRKYTPIKTGRARSGWSSKTNKDGFVVENYVPYIGYLEKGHSKQAPNGIIGPALTSVKGKLK